MVSRKNNRRSRPVHSEKSRRNPVYASKNNIKQEFHIKLNHLLGGVSLLSLLAAFEVFSIPAASGIIDILRLAKLTAGGVWVTTAILSGGLAVILDAEERDK